ncbi:LptF/LptG family permease [Borrelia parkeri]|uniref:Membrane spanning protein n=1 Tax=Borrelia parkeri SLO TaxID=1313294 RepID=A0ABN4C4S7_BORPR|nr:LptF/LptG family permease [Borrelia parkeri]AHE63116.1 membrane protein [Borrelia parkeri HR1]AHH09115.1 Putative membrane spanning protein [Borrelia parkeri SLO]UPA10937.1 LptF/LptG family permease [Borrelia parkeri]
MRVLKNNYESYIIIEFFKYFLITFLFFFFVFFINQILFFMRILLQNYVPFLKAFIFVIYSLPMIIALSPPFAALLSVILTIYRFKLNNEILAFRSIGISIFDLLIPFFKLGIVIALISFITNDFLLPLGSIGRLKIFNEIKEEIPHLILKPYSSKQYGDLIFVSGEKSETGYKNVTFFDNTRLKGYDRILMARELNIQKENYQVYFILNDVLSIALTEDESGFYDYFYADRMKYSIDQVTFSDSWLLSYVAPSQMSIRDVMKLIVKQDKLVKELNMKNDLEEDLLYLNFSNIYLNYLYDKNSFLDEESVLENLSYMHNLSLNYSPYEDLIVKRSYALYCLEFYQKISLPLSVLFFIFLAFGMGMYSNKKYSIILELVISILICVFYWVMFIGGKVYTVQYSPNPFLITVLPNVMLIFAGLILFLRLLKK